MSIKVIGADSNKFSEAILYSPVPAAILFPVLTPDLFPVLTLEMEVLVLVSAALGLIPPT